MRNQSDLLALPNPTLLAELEKIIFDLVVTADQSYRQSHVVSVNMSKVLHLATLQGVAYSDRPMCFPRIGSFQFEAPVRFQHERRIYRTMGAIKLEFGPIRRDFQ